MPARSSRGSSPFPGEDGVVEYSEGRSIGYRHFEATDHEAIYPFGHGRSYATFAYRDAEQVAGSTVRVTVENTSSRAGREVVQAYMRSTGAGRADDPRRELAGFASVCVPAEESVAVDIDLHERAFARYGDDGWRDSEGPFVVDVARSATDRRISVDLRRE